MLSVKQVAAALGVSTKTVQRMLGRELAYHKIGRLIRIDPSEVESLKARTLWPSNRTSTRAATAGGRSSSSNVEFVFSDGSRPARRKPRPFNLKLVRGQS